MSAGRSSAPPPVQSLRAEHSEATRRALIDRAREAFATVGYQQAGIEDVSRAARVSRGALYHHFRDKKALFEAVVEQMQAEAAAAVATRAGRARNPWSQLMAGAEAYLEICTRPEFRRIAIEDAPAVLGKLRCAELNDAHAMGVLRDKLALLQASGRMAPVGVAVLSALMGAMISEGAALLASPTRDGATPEQVHKALRTFLEAFRVG